MRTTSSLKLETSAGSSRSLTGLKYADGDLDKSLYAMEKGNNVIRLQLLKKNDPNPRKVRYSRRSHQIVLAKCSAECSGTQNSSSVNRSKAQHLDIRVIREVHTLEYKLDVLRITDKWMKDKVLKVSDPSRVLIISYGVSFIANSWILLFEKADECRLWCHGLTKLLNDYQMLSHREKVNLWVFKQFVSYMDPATEKIAMKHIKPFVQTKLQLKVQSRQLVDMFEDDVDFDSFLASYYRLLNMNNFFLDRFSKYIVDCDQIVMYSNFVRFVRECQMEFLDDRGQIAEQMRRFLGESNTVDAQPNLSVENFCDFLFSQENSVWDPLHESVVHDMNRPLSHYWIASSHNTYLTGDQLRSESSLEAYSRALLLGCRCIELDCWDGPKRGGSECSEIVIYHGYTMTSKISLRDVLHTIRHYAFVTSEFPVILSIEDNCSVPAQRLMAQDIKEILGDLLLTSPVSKDETELPSPAALKRKIILKHKKLALDTDSMSSSYLPLEDDQENDCLPKNCVKRRIVQMKEMHTTEWKQYVLALTHEKLFYMLAPTTDSPKSDDLPTLGEDDDTDEPSRSDEYDIRPEEMHVTEEWFHGKIDRDTAKVRLMEQREKGNGVFLVRESSTFIGDYSVSFLHNNVVHHCRIRTMIKDAMKKYYFQDNKLSDTLFELISYYTKVYLETPKFKTLLKTSCPQPQTHLNEVWFSATADQKKAEELLSKVPEDGAFLIRYSSTDSNVFVLSLRVDGQIWHYRLKRDGRIFIVNQTIFENLNQMVDFYSTREFVRGIPLRYPVSAQNVDLYASGELIEHAPGCYMDLKDLKGETEVRSVRSFEGTDQTHLSFPANAIIKVTRKDSNFWKGSYAGQDGWFPPDCVEEIQNSNCAVVKTGWELAGMAVEKVEADEKHTMKVTTHAGHPHSARYLISFESEEELNDWLSVVSELARTVNDRLIQLRNKEKHLRIASELSDLVVYCQAVPFDPNNIANGSFYEMCSFSETKHEKILEKGLVQFNIRQLSRVYPMGSRMTSSNFNPVPMWNSGCHMVALNYQTPDRSMQLNHGKFIANGRCGYVLKPAYLLNEHFRPELANMVTTSHPIDLTIHVVAGRHLARKDNTKGMCSPLVEVEIIGAECDSRSVSTRAISANGLCPIWSEKFFFKVFCPEIALLRFHVQDGDFVSEPFIGQAVYPLDCIRNGYRSVLLQNQYSEPLELSSLLVYVDIRSSSGQRDSIFKSSRNELQEGRLAKGINCLLSKRTASTYSLNGQCQPSAAPAPSGNLLSRSEVPPPIPPREREVSAVDALPQAPPPPTSPSNSSKGTNFASVGKSISMESKTFCSNGSLNSSGSRLSFDAPPYVPLNSSPTASLLQNHRNVSADSETILPASSRKSSGSTLRKIFRFGSKS
uniref:Phosphoinositide phospholipase C n=1 Tax=Steinernema glaseri TaxID=37863 RepID=A0A1I8AVM3_9BILA